ncbi:MAG: SemiSWEET transporter [Hyphomicrobiales bacterium]
MGLVDYLGYAAAACTTGAYIPQVLRVWRTRSTHDISLKAFLALVTGLALWLAYGIWKGDFPMIAANGTTLALASTILYLKLKEARAGRHSG